MSSTGHWNPQDLGQTPPCSTRPHPGSVHTSRGTAPGPSDSPPLLQTRLLPRPCWFPSTLVPCAVSPQSPEGMARAEGSQRRLLALYAGGTIGMRSEGGGEPRGGGGAGVADGSLPVGIG